MAKNIEPKLKKIGDYLELDEETVFTIPEYQRPYSWEKEHCDKLWQDILDFSESENKDRYFFGTIIINCQDDDMKLGLIDGQQRTTTFLLLLKALLVRINVAIGNTDNDEESESLCRGLKERRRRIMKILYKAETEDIPDKPDRDKDIELSKDSVVMENNSINEQYKEDLALILRAIDYEQAEASVTRIPYKQKDNKYTNFFKNFKFFYETIDELPESKLNSIAKTVTDNCEVIEIKSWQVEQAITMFNSLNSDGLPLYDADIISARLYAEAEHNGESEKFKELWKEVLEKIGVLNQKGIATVDSILQQHMYYERTIGGETVSETGATIVATPGLRRYYIDINKEMVKKPVELCEHLINLTKIWDKVSAYPSMQVLFKFNENAKFFLASFFYRFNEENISEREVCNLAEDILKLFTIMELVDAGYSSKYFKTFLFEEEVKLVNETIDIEEINKDFDHHIKKNWSRDEIKSLIKEYDKHMLVYLNEYLFAKENDKPFELGSKYDIEHIMPSSGSNLQEIRRDAGIESEIEFRSIVNKIGNKILLEEKINRSIQNEWFRGKVSTRLHEKTGYIDSRFPIAIDLVEKYKSVDKPYWTKDDIADATEKASERIVEFIFGE